MQAFIAKLKDSKTDIGVLAVYTLISDPEANGFGNTVLYAMNEAGIDFKWGRIPTVMDVKISVSLTGVTLHDLRDGKTCHALMNAFSTLGNVAAGCFFDDMPTEIPCHLCLSCSSNPRFIPFRSIWAHLICRRLLGNQNDCTGERDEQFTVAHFPYVDGPLLARCFAVF